MADWSDLTFPLNSQEYVAQQKTFINRAESVATEVENARNGESSLQAIINAKISYSGLTSDLSAGGYRIHSLGNAVAPGDAVNLSTAQALLSGGGTPSNIAITGLNVGSLAPGQIPINSGGVIVGYTIPTATIGQRLFNGLLGGN